MNTEKMRDSAMKLLLSLEEMDAGLLMLSVVLTMLLAILIGSYRYYCIYMKRKAPWNVPRLWGHSSFKVVSWILFVVPSLWAASAVGILITRYIGGIA
ncbi:MAG: hypothetical protein KAR06_03200, partial [Deltaproteobacteria bacterium]|nr:hypothetical protein [Deltaproteobacteria bacterium]